MWIILIFEFTQASFCLLKINFNYLQKINLKWLVTRVKFANNDKSLLATCGLDGSLVICQVIPSPATTIYKLEGHQSGIMGKCLVFIKLFKSYYGSYFKIFHLCEEI